MTSPMRQRLRRRRAKGDGDAQLNHAVEVKVVETVDDDRCSSYGGGVGRRSRRKCSKPSVDESSLISNPQKALTLQQQQQQQKEKQPRQRRTPLAVISELQRPCPQQRQQHYHSQSQAQSMQRTILKTPAQSAVNKHNTLGLTPRSHIVLNKSEGRRRFQEEGEGGEEEEEDGGECGEDRIKQQRRRRASFSRGEDSPASFSIGWDCSVVNILDDFPEEIWRQCPTKYLQSS